MRPVISVLENLSWPGKQTCGCQRRSLLKSAFQMEVMKAGQPWWVEAFRTFKGGNNHHHNNGSVNCISAPAPSGRRGDGNPEN